MVSESFMSVTKAWTVVVEAQVEVNADREIGHGSYGTSQSTGHGTGKKETHFWRSAHDIEAAPR